MEIDSSIPNEDSKISPKHPLKSQMQTTGLLSMIFCVSFSSFSNSPSFTQLKTLTEISDVYTLSIGPAGWAFAIWSVIYTLMLVFGIQQALPASWVSSRNDDLIFTQIGWLQSINMVSNAFWTTLFRISDTLGFGLALLDIIVILSTTIAMMMQSTRSEVNITEFIALRIGASIYGGWVTAATILNVSFVLKSIGVDKSNGVDEELVGIVILQVAFAVYNAAQMREYNFMYGSVFIWVLTAIRSNLVEKIESAEYLQYDMKFNVEVLLIVHTTGIVLMAGYHLYLMQTEKLERGLFQKLKCN